MKTIHEILSDPDSLLSLSDSQLKTLLAPYIPEARKAILPEEKASKLGIHSRVMKDVLARFAEDPKMAAALAALRTARK